MSFFPIIELVDRYAIAKLKFNKTAANRAELDFYTQQLEQQDISKISIQLDELYSIHQKIWELESELKSGLDTLLPLEEIGRRAIEIRNWNNQRIELKNAIAEQLGCIVREIKKDHISQ
jgi:two-component sensor histidine kinase